MEHSWILILAMIGHVLCVYCDRLILCTPGGNFNYSDIKDNEKMARLFTAMPESAPLRSLVLGTLAMFLQFFGYLALGIWMRQYSALWANIMIVGAAMIYTFGLAHHIQGCAAEWIYIKSDHSEEGRKLTADFWDKTSAVMIGCYAGIILFSVAHFIPVVAGMTALPAWACVFNLLPLFLVQAPFNIPGAGNIAGAVMYLGLFILFLI
ncbi:MAG: hypothetical protein IJV14_19180 [Lachnospiraceae bacterium]|nr:hypothetical protein [Lachnospiraceae bacterium]